MDLAILIPVSMIVVKVLRVLVPKLPHVALPWVSVLTAVAGQVALLQYEGDAITHIQLLEAAITGLATSGLWSGGGKAAFKVLGAVRRTKAQSAPKEGE